MTGPCLLDGRRMKSAIRWRTRCSPDEASGVERSMLNLDLKVSLLLQVKIAVQLMIDGLKA